MEEEEKDKPSQKLPQISLEKLLDATTDILLILNSRGEVSFINQKGCELLGYTKNEIVGKNWFECFLPRKIRKKASNVFQSLIKGEIKKDHLYVNPVLSRNKEERLIEWHNSLIRDQQGQIIGTLSSGTDITDQKRVQEDLQKREGYLQAIIISAPIIIFSLDKKGRLTLLEGKGLDQLKIKPKEVLGHSIFEAFRVNSGVGEKIKRALAGEAVSALIERGQRIFETFLYPMKDVSGLGAGVFGVALDVTEQRKIEEELIFATKMTGDIIEAMGDGVALVSLDGIIKKVNREFERHTGYSRDEILGRSFEKTGLFSQEDIERIRERIIPELLKKGFVRNIEVEIKRKDKKKFPLLMSWSLLKDRQGKPIDIVTVSKDITELKLMDLLLRRQRDELVIRNRITARMLETFELKKRLRVILGEIMDLFQLSMGTVHLWEDGKMILYYGRGLSRKLRNRLSALTEKDLLQFMAQHNIYYEPLETHKKIPDFIKAEGIKVLISIPLTIEKVREGRKDSSSWLGTILLASRRYEFFSSDEVKILQGVTEQLALAVDHSIRYERARERLQRLETLRRIDLAIMERHFIREILKIIVEKVPQDLGADAIAISLYDEEKRKSSVFIMKMPNGALIEEEAFELAEDLKESYLREKRPIIIHDLSSDPRIKSKKEIIQRHKLCSYLGVPLIAARETIGILHILTCQNKIFTKEDIEFFQTLAGQASIALKSAHLVENLRESERKFRVIAASAHDAIVMTDDQGRITFWNKAAEKIFGYSALEADKRNIHELILVEAPSTFKGRNRERDDSKPSFFPSGRFRGLMELTAQRKDGKKIPVELSLTAVKLKGRVYVVGIFRDISRRKKDEEVLRIREKAMTSSLNALVLTDIKGQIEYINPSFLKIWGYSQEDEVIGKFIFSFWRSKKIGQQIFKKIMIDGAWTGEGVGKRKDGTFFDAYIWGNIVHDEKGRVRSVLASVVDISPQKKAERHLQESLGKLKETLEKTIYALATALEMRDPYTAGHQKRVADLSRAIAQEMGLSQEKVESIYMAGLIHDVGKIYIPAEILSKPARLTETEFSLIKEHPRKGYEILKDIDFPWPIGRIILQHHERLNGSGYPKGLSGKKTLLEARILAVADVVEAIASHRPYRPSRGVEAAMEEIRENKGILYDPEVVDSCLYLFNQKGYQLVD